MWVMAIVFLKSRMLIQEKNVDNTICSTRLTKNDRVGDRYFEQMSTAPSLYLRLMESIVEERRER